MSLYDVANWFFFLFFICQYVLTCFLLLDEELCWQNVTGLLSIHSGNKQWQTMHSDLASLAKIEVLLLTSSRFIVQG